jgi:hypothetical protein
MFQVPKLMDRRWVALLMDLEPQEVQVKGLVKAQRNLKNQGQNGNEDHQEMMSQVLSLEVPSMDQESLVVQAKVPVKAHTSQINLVQNGHADRQKMMFRVQSLLGRLMDLVSQVAQDRLQEIPKRSMLKMLLIG